MKQRRQRYTPSSSHLLAVMVTDLNTPRTSERISKHLERVRDRVANLAGIAGPDWAISQLSTSPFVVTGWPNPCKAARMSMGKAVRA